MDEDLKPSWLDEAFVKQVIKSVEGLDEEQIISVSGWQCNHAVPPGTNYLSLLYRLRLDYKIEDEIRSISLIVKVPLEVGHIKEYLEKVDGYGKELKMYREVLPKMYEIANNCMTVTPQSYDCPLHNSLVLEDLRESGYKLANRLKQLDAAHCRQFLISLGKFHGLTVAVSHKDPHLFQSVGKSWFFDESEPEEEKKFTNFCLTTLSKVSKSLGLEKYAEILQGKIDSFFETMVRIARPSGELRVLNHGDCWTTNFLFKYDDSGEVIDAKLVDFQTIRIGSFAQDVIHFWWTSARQDVRENLQEEMFEVYRKTLNQTLEDVGMSERVTKEEFDNEIKRFAPYSLEVCGWMLSVAMADPDDLLDISGGDAFDKPFTEDSDLSKNFHSKYYKALLPDLFRQLERFGAFI